MDKNLISTAMMLCDYCKTDYSSKKHGGYKIYDDGKIRIVLDTYVPNLDVFIIDKDKKLFPVLCRAYHGHNQCYHPGKWEEYILSLRQKALTAMHKKKASIQKRIDEEHSKKFSPVNEELDRLF